MAAYHPAVSSGGASQPSASTFTRHNILAHAVDPYEERDYRKGSSRVRANPLLVKVQTGKVKATTYALPPEGFTYGRRDQYEEEGVKEVVNSWQHHVPPPEVVPGRDFVKLNRTAVVHGAVSSKDIAQFRTTHDARLKSSSSIAAANKASSAAAATPKIDPNFTYGRPSKPSTPIHDVLCNSFQRNAIIAARRQQAFAEAEAERERASKAGKSFGQSQHTRASLGHMKLRAPPPKEPFKLEKFKNVESRIASQFHGHQNQQRMQQQQQQQYQQQEQSSPQQQHSYDDHSAHQQSQHDGYRPSSERFEEQKYQEEQF